MISLTLQGEMPSKKNAWRRSSTGKVYIPSNIQASIDDFLWQITQERLRPGLNKTIESPVSVDAIFYGNTRRDLDNMVTTLLDILQKSLVIKNDSQVYTISTSKCYNKDPYLTVIIKPIIISHASEEDQDIIKKSK